MNMVLVSKRPPRLLHQSEAFIYSASFLPSPDLRKFNALSSPIETSLRSTFYYQLEQSAIHKQLDNSAQTYDSMEETYQTQLPLIWRRLEAIGVTYSELMDLYSASSNEVHGEHSDRSIAWCDAKIEYHIWNRYFPTEDFPGALIRKPSAAVLPSRSSRPASRPSLDKEWIHDRFEPGPIEREKARHITRGDFPDRYKGQACPDVGSGDFYRPLPVKPVQAPALLPAPDPALLPAPTRPKSLAQEDLRRYDQQNPSRLSRSEGLAGLIPANVGAAIIPATVPQGPSPRGRVTQAEMREYDKANPTSLNVEPISNQRGFTSSGHGKSSTSAALLIPSSGSMTDYSSGSRSKAAGSHLRASSLSTREGRRVFIGNLPVSRPDDLRNLFRGYNIEDIYIPTNSLTNRQDKPFGFVEPRSSSEAQKLIANFHGVDFRGHSLQISLAQDKDGNRIQEKQNTHDRGMKNTRAVRTQPKTITYEIAMQRATEGRRLILGNLPLQTENKDLSDFLIGIGVSGMQLIKRDEPLRLVYAFIDTQAPDTAQKAISALSGTIMLGQRVAVALASQATVSAHNKGNWTDMVRLHGKNFFCHNDKPYLNQEKLMEKRAEKGGLRHELFAFLQKARDQARRNHPECTRSIRAYLSDKLTWTHFFRDPFPGVEPIDCHTKSCLQSMGRIPEGPFPVLGAAAPSPSVPTNLSSNFVSRSATAMRPSMASGGPATAMKPSVASYSPVKVIETESMDDLHSTVVAESALASASAADAEMEITGSRVVSKPRDWNRSSRSQTPKVLLPAQSAPDLARSNSYSIMTSAAHEAVLVGGTDSVARSSPDTVITDVVGLDPAISKPTDLSMGPKECWNTFKAKFNMDEAAKAQLEQEIQAQGQLRMVLDASSGQMVTVEELVRRTQLRATLKMKLAGNSKGVLAPLAKAEVDGLTKANAPVKRKQGEDDDELGGDENERAQKKARNFLDSFEKEYTK